MAPSRRDILKALAAGGVGVTVGTGFHGYAYERQNLQVARARLPVLGLAPALDGLRIGLLTDVHHSSFVSLDDVRRAADLLLAERPDVIVLGGDYVTNFDNRYLEPCVDALSHLQAPHGVFAVLGNHDDERRTAAALARRGFSVLANARSSITIAGETLDFVGVRFWTREPERIEPILRGARGTIILLAHDPRRLQQAAQFAIPLVLSGHTHGGQVVLPYLGAIGARRFPVVAGFAEQDGSSIFVSRGVGTVVLPIRINCPPDVAVVALTPRPPLDLKR